MCWVSYAERLYNISLDFGLSISVLKTPQILELSGVGDSSLLNKFNIQTNVDLPGVGTMVQDHIFTSICWGIFKF